MSSYRVGIVSDTHMPASVRTLWDEIATAFEGVDLILHAGDIVLPSVLDQLEAIAPVLAARGNNDPGWEDARVADAQWLDLEGFRIAMVHDMEPEDEPIDVLSRKYLGGERADVMVTGHTHFERLAWRDGTLAGEPRQSRPSPPLVDAPRHGGAPRARAGHVRARIVRLGEHEGLRNPGVPFRFDGETVVVAE